MKKIDKYILCHYLFSLAVISLLFLGLFLIVDFFTKLKTFLQIQQVNPFYFIGQYYFYRLPLILVELSPIITLVAAMFTLTRLVRTREFIPLLAAGISFYRIIIPLFLVTLLISSGIFLVNELVIPRLEKELSRTDKILKSEGMERYVLTHDRDNSSLVIEKYDYTHKIMHHLTMIKLSPEEKFQSIISAERAQWHPDLSPKGWYLYNGAIYPYDERGLRKDPIRFGEEGYPLGSAFTPEDLEKSEKSLTYMDMRELRRLILTHPHQPHLRMQLYNKVSLLLTALLLFILGVPVLLIGESHNLFVNIGICLVVTLGFYALRFLMVNIGSRGMIPPWVAFLIPIMAVIGISTVFVLSGKIRT